MTHPRIIGLSGVARAGKDTVGEILENLYGYKTKSFSDTLNKALIALNPRVDVKVPDLRVSRYADVIEEYGYEHAKEYPEIRTLLQRMGTEVGRDILGPNIWVEALFNDVGAWDKVAITNVRFPNEYAAVKEYGGVVWRVDRPGFEAANGHVSDTALDDYDFDATIYNNGTQRQLADRVMSLLDNHPNPLQAVFNR